MKTKYPVGTKIQRRDGHIYIKTGDYGFMKEARWLLYMHGEELGKFNRVFFRDGNREHVELQNVVSIRFNQTRFKYLPKARVIYIPRVEKKELSRR